MYKYRKKWRISNLTYRYIQTHTYIYIYLFTYIIYPCICILYASMHIVTGADHKLGWDCLPPLSHMHKNPLAIFESYKVGPLPGINGAYHNSIENDRSTSPSNFSQDASSHSSQGWNKSYSTKCVWEVWRGIYVYIYMYIWVITPSAEVTLNGGLIKGIPPKSP